MRLALVAWATAGFVLVECGPQSDGDLTGALPATSNVCGCEDASQECESTKGEVLALAETCREFCEERDDEDYTVRECDAAAMERIMASPRPAFFRLDPSGCGESCRNFDPFWEMVAQRFPRRAWRIDCAAEPTICHHAPAGSVPFFEVWTGVTFERYNGAKDPLALMEYLSERLIAAPGQTAKKKSREKKSRARDDADGACAALDDDEADVDTADLSQHVIRITDAELRCGAPSRATVRLATLLLRSSGYVILRRAMPNATLLPLRAAYRRGIEAVLRQHAEQEASGLLRFHVVHNDDEAQSLITLIEVKNIYTMQLPKMGAEYIVRLVLKPDHSSLICRHDGKVVGAITYRPHITQTFAEIAFCCVSATHQVQGYGTRMMNQLKEQAKREGIEFLLTYADDHAVNYFKKQGFQKQVTMTMTRWKGYIKDYNGATMMECRIDKHIDYLGTRRVAAQQRQHLLQKTLTLSKSHVVRPGLAPPLERQAGAPLLQAGAPLLQAIPGLAETPWRPPSQSFEMHGVPQPLETCLATVYRLVCAESNAKPFEKPVAKADAPDYYEIIKDPLDLATIGQRLRRGYYATPQMLMGDVSRMCENCKRYNGLDSTYSAQAERLEAFTRARIAEIRRVPAERGAEGDAKRPRLQ